MKIKNRTLSYDEVLAIQPEPHMPPKRPSMFFRTLLKALSSPELHAVDFSYTSKGMERLAPDEPALFLMNHSSFIDLKLRHLSSTPGRSILSVHQTALSANSI